MFGKILSRKHLAIVLFLYSLLLSSCLKKPYVGIADHPNDEWACREWPITLRCWCGAESASLMSEKKSGGSFSYDEASRIWGRMKIYGMDCFVEYYDGPQGASSEIAYIVTASYLLQGQDFTYDDYENHSRYEIFSGHAVWSGCDFSFAIDRHEDLAFVKTYIGVESDLDESDAPAVGDVWHFVGEAAK